ncbi:hypothetical protein M1523_03040 [Patescibacteria group bacterium]|nr:hypothetical protein [Patescibacteria group bacterium]MCL5091303.1 hypothetical protein [Patescibacteria group bacterium]
MNKRSVLIIAVACVVTAILVGFEVYVWQGATALSFIPGTALPAGNVKLNNAPVTKPNANYDEIKTKEEGIAACEYNRSYAKTVTDIEQKKAAEAMVDYCYAIIAGKFNDASLCQRTVDKAGCQQTAQELINMGKEIQNMPAEQRQQMQDAFKNFYKQ